MRILHIENDTSVAQSVELILRGEGMRIYRADAYDDDEAFDLARLYDFDVILLEPDHSDRDGTELLQRLRGAKVETPIVLLTHLGRDVQNRARLLDNGADDVLSKPFHSRELVARIRAVVRRSRGIAASVVHFGDLSVNLSQKTVSIAGSPVHLTGKEYSLLEVLALRQGTTMTKSAILNNLYGGRDEPDLRIIDVFICKLRKKLATASGGSSYIATVWGRGYMLRDERHMLTPSPSFIAQYSPAPALN